MTLGAREVPVVWLYALAAIVGAAVGAAHGTAIPVDYVLFAKAGAQLWAGHWGSVFGDHTIQAGPLQLLLLGLFRPLAHLRSGADVVTLSIAGSAAVSVGLVWGGLRLRAWLGLPSGQGVLPLVVLALAAAWGWVGNLDGLGHPAQFAVPALWIAAAVRLRRERAWSAGLLLAASTGFETWALLGVAVVVLAPTYRYAARASVGFVAGCLVLWLPFVLAGPFRMMDMTWPISDGTLARHLFSGSDFTAGMRLVQLGCAVGGAALVAWYVRHSRHGVWIVPLMALDIRLALDPLQFSYYWLAPLTVALVACIASIDFMHRRASAVGCVILSYCQIIAFGGAAKIPASLITASLLLWLAWVFRRAPDPAVTDEHSSDPTASAVRPATLAVPA